MPRARTTRQVSDTVERLLTELAEVADPAVQAKAEELARALVELYGAGLEEILAFMAAQPSGEERIRELAADSFVGSLLVLHGLHPVPVADRVQAALDSVRPYLGSHAGGVEFLGIDGQGVARLALQGSCDGCPSSLVTVQLAIERAIEEAAPELAGIDVQGVVAEPRQGLLQIQPYQPRPAEPEWFPLAVPALNGRVSTVDVAGVTLALCRAGEELYAYRDGCAACGGSLAEAALTGTELACPSCGARFDVQLAGRAADGSAVHLDPIPLVGREGHVSVALAGTAP
jgi:Fe-S cluster biogenesis protein NfuA/nitrite reductase/ring-hydroxylating ferredoxin subunit